MAWSLMQTRAALTNRFTHKPVFFTFLFYQVSLVCTTLQITLVIKVMFSAINNRAAASFSLNFIKLASSSIACSLWWFDLEPSSFESSSLLVFGKKHFKTILSTLQPMQGQCSNTVWKSLSLRLEFAGKRPIKNFARSSLNVNARNSLISSWSYS